MTATLTESPALPERIAGLATLARHNPFALLRRVDPARLAACAADPEFLRPYDALIERAAREASNAGTWFATTYPDVTSGTVAYFCAEFGLHNSVPVYSGGLGILAGDHCKAASDLGIPVVAVGLLYRYVYFRQRLNRGGSQEAIFSNWNFYELPITPNREANGNNLPNTVDIKDHPVHVRV